MNRRVPIARRLRFAVSIAAYALFANSESPLAHEGHADAPAETVGPASEPIHLSPEARQNLGILLAIAEVKPITSGFQSYGEVRSIPNRLALTTSPFAGLVLSVKVRPGMKVTAGQPLLELQSLALAENPVRVTLRAGRAGKVLSLPVSEGASVETGTVLAEIGGLETVQVVARVFENRIGDVTLGQGARITAPSLSQALKSQVETIAGSVDPERHTLEVGMTVANPGEKLKLNMAVTVYFTTGDGEDVIAIPRRAVLGQGGERFVFVAEDGAFKRTPVILGRSDESAIEVIEGVAPGDSVVIQGNYQLQFTRPAAGKGGAHAR